MGYIHVEIIARQSSKHAGRPCGDIVAYDRSSMATTLLCCDGIGSGIKANLAATMCVSRLRELMKSGFSMREAFGAVVKTMNQWRDPALPYAAFVVARILSDGNATILSYEMPEPIYLTPYAASVLKQQVLTVDDSLIGEATCQLDPGDGLLLVTDGITQAGLGTAYASGWGAAGVCSYINKNLMGSMEAKNISAEVHNRARQIWGTAAGDDCTAALAYCRHGKAVTIMTGPPSHPKNDARIVREFIQPAGMKVVCGATTAMVVARYIGKTVAVEQGAQSLIAPPKYAIDGIDLVTEGAVTLNQVYNIIDADPSEFEEQSGVTDIYAMLMQADNVNFILGGAMNPASENISFRQKGVLGRRQIVALLADKLRTMGKLVLIRNI